MADTKIVGAGGFARASKAQQENGSALTPPFKKKTTTIFVRDHGSNENGDGSHSSPFRTLRFATRTVPSILDPGETVVFDVTGITETLPPDYEFPTILATTTGPSTPSPSPFFDTGSGVVITATPRLTTLLSAADATIGAGDLGPLAVSSDPISGLVTLTLDTGRTAWGINALKGKQLVRSVKSGTSADTTCAIYGNDNQNLFLCNDAGSLNGVSGPPTTPIPPPGPLVLAPGEVLQIVEPSATLIGSPPTVNFPAISCWNINAISFQGIHFVAPVGGPALGVGNASTPSLEMCVVEGFYSINTPNGFFFTGTVFSLSYDLEPVPGLPTRSLFMNFNQPQSYFYIADQLQTFNDVVFDDTCPTVTSGVFFVGVPSNWGFGNVLFQGSIGDAIHVDSGQWNLVNVRIDGASGNGITVDTGPAYVALTNVGSVVPNGGAGISIQDGIQVTADVATTTTNPGAGNPLTGPSGEIAIGSLGTQGWATLAASPNNIVDNTGASATLSRISQS